MSRPKLTFCHVLVALFLVVSTVAMATDSASSSTEDEVQYRASIPLGVERLLAMPAYKGLVLMATAENPVFATWRQNREIRGVVHNQDGERIEFLPENLDFRVTASLRLDELIFEDITRVEMPHDVQGVMNSLKFRLRIFHGLDVKTIEPANVAVIGVPMNVPYDERIWRVSFDIPQQTPVMDKLVLEIMSPEGERLSKFHLEF